MSTEALGFNTVIMSNSTEAVLLSVAAYFLVGYAAKTVTNWLLQRTSVALPARIFSPSKHRVLRDAWNDGSIAFFGIACLLIWMDQSTAIAMMLLVVSAVMSCARVAGDSPFLRLRA